MIRTLNDAKKNKNIGNSAKAEIENSNKNEQKSTVEEEVKK